MTDIERPALEGTVAVRDGRRLSFAEYGSPRGAAIIWMPGTPGARRQIPLEARAYADAHGIRIIGVDRPGSGSSTPWLYDRIGDWTGDLELLLDALAIDTCRLIGLSGGGPYVPAAGAHPPPAATCWQPVRPCPSGCTASGSSAASSRPAAPTRSRVARSSSRSGWPRCCS